MKLTAAVILSCLALLAQSVQGQLCYDDQLPCVSDASCVDNECECDPGFVGLGRIYCGDETVTPCMCSFLADPQFSPFDQPDLGASINLPCSVNLLAPPPGTFFFVGGACVMQRFQAHMEIRDAPYRPLGPALRTFVSFISVEGFWASGSILFSVSSDIGVDIQTNGGGIITSSVQDGFYTAQLDTCNIRVGINDTYAGSYIALPDFLGADGICGNCDGNMDDENIGSTPEDHLEYYLQHLTSAADQQGPFDTQCGNLETAVSSCTGLTAAVSVCINYLNTYGNCILNNPSSTASLTPDSLMSNFVTCMTNMCSGSGSAATECAVLDAFTSQCNLGTCP